MPYERNDFANLRFVGLALLACLGATSAAGCDEDHLRTLTPADVTGFPAGDAVGTGFSGQYQSANVSLLGCACRTAGSCSTLATYLRQGAVTLSMMVTQTDGAIAFDVPCTGGVDTRGGFRCGGVSQNGTADGYNILTGRFVLSGVVVEGMTVLWESTTVDVLAGHDCDMSLRGSFFYLGP